MKLSVSLRPTDVEFVDQYLAEHGERSRSAVVRKALELLREQAIGEMYDVAWRQWVEDGEDKIWDLAVGDGLEPEDWSSERGGRPQPAV